ncbi:MAG: DUF362 domain-containing protein [Bacteroidetes bacterium]|nr:DUF362 domain-containing protein [Bacteroidota bacterium]
MAKVALVKGNESYEAVSRALELVRGEVHIPNDRPILVKPNMVQATVDLCATPVGAVRATLDFLQSLGAKKFIIGEATAGPQGDTMGGFKRYGYMPLKDEYDVELRDFNEDDTVLFEALDPGLNPVHIRLNKTYLECYVVSVARMKSHAQVVATMSIKNIAISSIHNPDRHSWSWHTPQPGKFGHEPRPLNLSLARLYQTVTPSLAIVDGVVGMEGNGPVEGTPVASGVALASTNALALDLVGTGLMGFDYRTIGYLWYLSQLQGLARGEIQVLGEDPAACVTPYKAHDKLAWQLGWWVEHWQEYLKKGSYLVQ